MVQSRQALGNARAVYQVDPATGAAFPAPQVGGQQVVLYNAAGNPLIVAAASDGRAASQLGLLTDSRSMALNPAGTLDQLRVNALKDLLVMQRPAASWQTGTAAAGTGVTLTIPAAGAGVFNYLCFLHVVLYAAVALVGGATPTIVTTTGLTGTPAWDFPTALAIGTQAEAKYEGQAPLIGSAANTALTVVCPATTNGIWRANVAYFTA